MKDLRPPGKITAINRRRKVLEEMLRASREFQTNRGELDTSVEDYQLKLFSLLGVGKKRTRRERALI